MQGPSSSVENLNFDHGTVSGDVESQMSWSSMPNSVQNRLPQYRLPSSEADNQYLQHVRHEAPNVEWSLGEASSSLSQHVGDQNERKMEHTWAFGPRANPSLEEPQSKRSNIFSLDTNGNPNALGSFGLRTSSSNAFPQDLNMVSGLVDSEDDDCQVVELPSSYMSLEPSNELMRSAGSSSDSFVMPSGRGGYVMDEREDRPGCSLDGRRISCKRKALEVHTRQSAGVGSSNCFQTDERSQWHNTVPAAHVAVSNTSMPRPTENNLVINSGSELANPRLRLGVGGADSASPFSVTSSGNADSSRRNLRMRINGLYQQDTLPSNHPFSTETNLGNVDVPSSRYSSRLLRNHLFDMTPVPPVENASLNSQPVLQVPPMRRHHQSRWSGASSSRSSRPSVVAAVSEERMPFGESSSRHVPGNISGHPMFIPASEMGNSSQNPANWNMPNTSIVGNAASISRAGTSAGPNASLPSWSHRSYPQYPRRISELVRRSLLSTAGAEAGGQSSNHAIRAGSSALPQEMVLPSGSDSHGHRVLNSRSAYLDRRLEGALGIPYPLRTLAAASEGRGSIMSEQIRQVLDLMRRGEGLRFEDVMILDHSVLLGMADIHDRHRDMRLDVDNMSYEELLALEERIGNVCTGLNEETISSRLKRRKHAVDGVDAPEAEPCSICREEYSGGEDLAALECGHNFHADCIKQWLMQKNLCPICKTTGLTP